MPTKISRLAFGCVRAATDRRAGSCSMMTSLPPAHHRAEQGRGAPVREGGPLRWAPLYPLPQRGGNREGPCRPAGYIYRGGLEKQLERGAKALIGNTDHRRYVRAKGEAGFEIDAGKLAEEATFDGLLVSRTNA